MNSINILSSSLIDFEDFKKINYSILEPAFWPQLHKLFDEFNLSYYFIGLNVFKNKNICPILIDFNSVSNVEKERIWRNIFFNTTNFYDSEFDKIYLFQNLIKSDLALDEFKNLVSKIISFNKKNVFRVYDPRVALHLRTFFPNFNTLPSFINEWNISLNGNWYKLCFIGNAKFSKKLYEIEKINWKIRFEIDSLNQIQDKVDLNLILNKIYGEFNE